MTHQRRIALLKAASVLTIATGLISSLATVDATSEPWRLLFDLLRWPIDGDPSSFGPEAKAVSAVLGGVMAGWGWMMFRLVAGPLASGDRQTHEAIRGGVIVWFAVDSAGSVLAGIPGNVVLNVGFLLAFLIPLSGWSARGER